MDRIWCNVKEKYDIIISNPPYLHPSESIQLDKNIRHEPNIALFTPKDNPLHFYEKILEFASINLSKNGIIYLEINPNFIVLGGYNLKFNSYLKKTQSIKKIYWLERVDEGNLIKKYLVLAKKMSNFNPILKISNV